MTRSKGFNAVELVRRLLGTDLPENVELIEDKEFEVAARFRKRQDQ
jgi:hypothetical protein